MNKYNTTHHSKRKKSSTYTNLMKKDPEFEVDDHVRISKHKTIFEKRLHPILV